MRVLNVSGRDYANYSNSIANALRSVGVDCIDLCLDPHKFNYPTASACVKLPVMIDRIKKADVIQIMHSDIKLFDLARAQNPGAEIVIFHTGSRYRQDHAKMNKHFAGYKTVTDQTELMKHGNHSYVVSPVEARRSVFNCSKPIKIGHFPSSTEVKGTDDIIKMLKPFSGRFKWLHSTDFVPNKKQIERMTKCDVYIELFKPVLWGKEYGCFGVTALEAAALGKLVITQDLNPNVYAESYGEHPFFLANSATEFHNAIETLLSNGPELVKKLQRKSHAIMKENHSFKATGRRVLSIIKL